MKSFCRKSTLFSLVLFLLVQILLPANTKQVEASGGFMPQAFAKLTIKKVVSDLQDVTDPLISAEKFTFEVVPTKIGYQDVTVNDYGEAYYTDTQDGYTSEVPLFLSLGQLNDTSYDQDQISIDLPISSLEYSSSDNAYSTAIDTEVALWFYSGTTICGYDTEGADAEHVDEYFFQTRQAAENADIHPGRGTELIDGEYYVPISFELKEKDNGSSYFEYDSTPQSFTYYVKLQKEIKGQSKNYSTGEEFGPFMVRFFAVDDGLFGSSENSFQTIPQSLSATFTNTFVPPKDTYYTFVGASLDIPENVTEVTMNKVWEGDTPENRPEKITIILYQDESQYDTTELTTTENTSHTFTNLPKYNYELPDDFSFTFNIVNKESGEFVSSHTATLKENSELEISPIPSLIEISKSGEHFEYSIQPIETEDYQITGDIFDDVGEGNLEFLFNFEFKNEHVYTVGEVTPDGYHKYINGFTITNIGNKDISVEKFWNHGDNPVDQRPQSVTIHLKANDKIVASYTHEGSENFEYTFKNLPVYDEDKQIIIYEISEEDVDGYSSDISKQEDMFFITNTYSNSPHKDITITKTWIHNNNPSGSRPKSVTINLLANGEIVDSYTHEGSDDFSYTFENLPVYDENDEQIDYTISENEVKNYKSTIDGFNVTNEYENLWTLNINKYGEENTVINRMGTIYELEGAVFHIFDAETNEEIPIETTGNVHTARNLQYNRLYYITEEPMKGYLTDKPRIIEPASDWYSGFHLNDYHHMAWGSFYQHSVSKMGLFAKNPSSFLLVSLDDITKEDIMKINNREIWLTDFSQVEGYFTEHRIENNEATILISNPESDVSENTYKPYKLLTIIKKWQNDNISTRPENISINSDGLDDYLQIDSNEWIRSNNEWRTEIKVPYLTNEINSPIYNQLLSQIRWYDEPPIFEWFSTDTFSFSNYTFSENTPDNYTSSMNYFEEEVILHEFTIEEMFDDSGNIIFAATDKNNLPLYTKKAENLAEFEKPFDITYYDQETNIFHLFYEYTDNPYFRLYVNDEIFSDLKLIGIPEGWGELSFIRNANGGGLDGEDIEEIELWQIPASETLMYSYPAYRGTTPVKTGDKIKLVKVYPTLEIVNTYDPSFTLHINKFGEKNTNLNRLGTIYELEGAVFHIFDAETDEELPIETIGNVHTVKGLKRNRAYYITEEPMEGFLTDKPRLISLSSDFYIYGHFNTYKHEGFGNHYSTPIKKIGIYTSYNNYSPSFGSLAVFDMSNLTKDDIVSINRNQFSLTFETAYQIKNDETTIYISNPEEEFSDDCYNPYKSLKIIKNWEGDSNDTRPDSITINAKNPDGNLVLDDADWIKEGDQWTKQIEIPFGTIESNNLTLMPSDYYRWGPLTFEWHLIGDTFNFDEYTFSEENSDGYSTTLNYYEDEEIINEFTINEFTNDYTTRIFAASDKNLYFLRNAENLTIFDKNLEIYNDSDPKLSDPRNPASPAYRFYTAEKNPYYRLYINDEVFSDLKTVFDCDSDIVLVFTDAATLLDFDLNKNKRIDLWGTPNGTVIYSFDIDNGLTPVQPGDKIKLVKVHPTLEITNTRIPEYPVSLQKRALNGLSNKIGSTMSLYNDDKVLLGQWVSKEEPQEFNLKPGKYSLTEDISPDGLLRVTNTMEFEVSNDGIVNIITNANIEEGKLSVENNLLTLEDVPEKINISITKIWLDNNNEFGLRPSKEDWLNSLHVYANDKELNLADYDVSIVESKSESGDSYIVTVKSVDAHDTEKLVEFTVSEDDIAGYESTVSLENGIIVVNKSTAKKQEKDLLIKKVDQNGDPVQGVTFEIYQNLNDELQLIHRGTTNEQGELNVTNVLASYSITGKIEDNLIDPILTVIEVEVPEDYVLDETPHTINILEENSIIIENWKIPTKNYDITKADLSTIVSIDGNSASNEKELYVIVDNDAQKFTVSDRIIYSGLRENTDYIVESSIAKIIGDEENIIVSISTERSTTEADGYWDITFNDIELTYEENAKYVVYEKVINKEDISEFISHKNPSDIAQTIILEKNEEPPVTPPVEPDEPKKVEINITKHILDGEPLSGVKLSVEGEDFFDEWITDDKPHVLSIVPGKYTLMELESVDGYKLITTSIVFEVTDDKELKLITKEVDGDGRVTLNDSNGIILENAPLPPEPPTPPIVEEPDVPPVINKYTVEFQKVDAENNTPLVGAQLQVKDKDGKILYSWSSTIASHKFVLELGSYTLSESSAPNGYKLADPIHFEVKDTDLINDKKIVLKNEKKPVITTPDTPVTPSPTAPQQPAQVNNTVNTGYDSNTLLYLFILSTCLSLVIYLQKKRARN